MIILFNYFKKFKYEVPKYPCYGVPATSLFWTLFCVVLYVLGILGAGCNELGLRHEYGLRCFSKVSFHL
jgi:hypothetical protein